MFKEKLKGVKVSLRKWNLEEFGMTQRKQQLIVKEMNELDILEELGSLDEESSKRRLQLQEDLWKVEKFNESLLLKKSRVRWIKEGDCNSKLFRSIINWRRRKSLLKGMDVDEEGVEDPGRVKEEVENVFFEKRFKEDNLYRPKVDGVAFKQILIEDNFSCVGIEARGFIFGPPIALAIGAKFVPLRKPKKLPSII